MSLLTEFRDNPVAFALKYPLTVPGPGKRMHFKEKSFQHDEKEVTGYQVSGAERIYWFDIGRMKGDPSMAEVQLQSGVEEELEEVVSAATKGEYSKIEVAGQKIVVTHAEGTVFGVRRKGDWTFYFQKRVRIQHLVNDYQSSVAKQSYLRYGLSWLNPFDYWSWARQCWSVQAEMWLPLTCKEFWPEGDGQVVLRNG